MSVISTEIEAAALSMAVEARKQINNIFADNGFTPEETQAIVDDAMTGLVVCGVRMFPKLEQPEAIARRKQIIEDARRRLS